jgi:LacI family transcriptional regulator
MRRKRPTIDHVAELAGVSIKTVSRVFNAEPNVRGVTRDRVMEAARELRYRPNQSARRLAADCAFVIGMLYDNPHGDYITEVQYGALRACRQRGYGLMIHPCDPNSPGLVDEVVDMYFQSRIDGYLVLQPVSDLDQLNRAFLENEISSVRLSQRPCQGMPWISVGDREAANEMTEYLVSLGHERIGFVVGHPDHGTSYDRLEGYRDALARHDIQYDESLVEQGFFDYESGYLAAVKLLSVEPRPTAIFASNDPMAMGVLTAAHESGLDVPHELSVAGFDDNTIARFAWPQLTTVRQPIADIAEVATKTLLDQLQGRTEGVTDHRLMASLVERASTGTRRVKGEGQ